MISRENNYAFAVTSHEDLEILFDFFKKTFKQEIKQEYHKVNSFNNFKNNVHKIIDIDLKGAWVYLKLNEFICDKNEALLGFDYLNRVKNPSKTYSFFKFVVIKNFKNIIRKEKLKNL